MIILRDLAAYLLIMLFSICVTYILWRSNDKRHSFFYYVHENGFSIAWFTFVLLVILYLMATDPLIANR